MSSARKPECPNCKRLLARLERLETRVKALEAENARLRKDSSTSHKPPSSDIVKPPRSKPLRGKKRKPGGQPGHKRHERPPFSPDELDDTRHYTLGKCPDCGGALKHASKPPRTVQQIELVEKPVIVTEHRAHSYWCPRCRKVHEAKLPADVRAAGLVGPRLNGLIAWLKGGAHLSYTTIQTLLRDVMKAKVSRGHLAKVVQKASHAMGPAYAEARVAVRSEPRLNVDETGHKDSGEKFWTWVFRAAQHTVFSIEDSRGSKVLRRVLGEEFDGVLGCDYYSAYHKYMGEMNVLVQFCLAHLLRDVKYLTTLDARNRKYGERVLRALKKLFGVFHRREAMTPQGLEAALERERKAVMRAARNPPWEREARNLANRFREHGESYFRFITTPGVEPTNNLAEQALRFVVIDRRITQGTRGEMGRVWCERIWTAGATCRQRGWSLYEYLCRTLQGYFSGHPPPSLVAA